MKKSNADVIAEMSASKYNGMVRCVNDNTPRNVVEKFYTKEQMKVYDDMVARLKEERKKNPKAAYGPTESEW